jgi:hypothetical protein
MTPKSAVVETYPRELHFREDEEIAVRLLWYADGDRIVVRVLDKLRQCAFELEVASRDALDAFRHPHAYRRFATT